MKAVLISIRPQWCLLIAQGKKTIEVRKTIPKLKPPFKAYIYCTNTKPFLVWGDVFRGNWETEFTHLYGYNRKDAEKIWDVFNGKVMGEFICDSIECFTTDYRMDREQTERISRLSCVDMCDLAEYEYNSPCLYGWHISDLQIYEKPKPLSEFRRPCDNDLYCEECGMYSENRNRCGNGALQLTRPPQSWGYVEAITNG